MEKLTPKKLIGMKKAAAIKLIESQKMVARVTVEDGKYFVGTDEINADRFNLTIVKGVVTNTAIG
jgi:hypothetical protein